LLLQGTLMTGTWVSTMLLLLLLLLLFFGSSHPEA
jgi:hypothetical protein